MKKLLTILLVLISFSTFAQFEAGEYVNSDTLKNKGSSIIYPHADSVEQFYYSKMRDPSEPLDGVNLRTLFDRLASLDTLGLNVSDLVSGSQLINAGETQIFFPSAFDSANVIVVPFVRRISDDAVIDFIVNDIDSLGFDVVIWEDSCKIQYVASQKITHSSDIFKEPIYSADSAYLKMHVRTDFDTDSTNEIQDLSGLVPFLGADRDVDLGANSISTDTVKINGVPLLLNTFKQGNLGGAGNIFYSTGASSQPASESVNQVIGGNLLTNTYLPLFNGTNFANSSISDNGSLVDFSRSQIQMSGNVPTITTNTSDGADTKRLALGGGGAFSSARGAYLYLAGNEYTTNPGSLVLSSGYITGSYIDFLSQGTSAMRLNSTSLSLLQTSGSLQPYTFTLGGNTARTIGLDRRSTTNSAGGSLSIFGGGATELMVSTVSITNGGTGYSINDVLTLSTDNAGAAATLTVTSVSGGVIDGVSITTKGSNYLTGDHTTTVAPVGGTGAIINVLTTESATDANGGTLALSSGVSTGTGSGIVIIRTPQPSVSGNTDNTLIARVFIKDDAVGIGASTAPISGTADVNNATGGILNLRRADASISANDMVGKIQFYANDASTTTNMIVADIEAQATNTVSTDINPGRLIFRTTPTTVAATPIEAMRITENQYVGISTSTPVERLDVNGNIIGDTIKTRADIIVTGEIYDEINHLYGMVYDSTITLSLTKNVWQQVTNPTKTLYSTAEQDGITISGDTIVFSKAGGYDVYFEFNCTGIDSKNYHYRILQENGTTTVRSYNKYASTGTQVVRNEKAYIHVAAGSKVWCEIMSPDSAPGSITIQGAKVYAMQCYLEK